MLDTSLIEQYISETFTTDFNDNKYSRETFNLINNFFNLTDVSYDDLTREELINIYSHLSIGKTSVFQSYKSRITDFMKWMYETKNGSIAPLNAIRDIYFRDIDRSEIYDTYYFENLDDLNDFMESIFGKEICDYSTFQCAALMVWHGIPLKHLSNMLKKNLSDDGVVMDPETNKSVQLSPKVVPYICEYRDAYTFNSNRFGGRTVLYKKTQYLFRTCQTENMTVKQLISTACSANRKILETGKIFQFERIYDSGIFYRVHEYEKKNGNISRNDYPLLKELFNMDHLDLNNKVHCYALLRKYDEYQDFKNFKYVK